MKWCGQSENICKYFKKLFGTNSFRPPDFKLSDFRFGILIDVMQCNDYHINDRLKERRDKFFQ